MAPGGEIFRYPQHLGENVLRHGSHEWLPYSKNEVRLKTVNNNLSVPFHRAISIFLAFPILFYPTPQEKAIAKKRLLLFRKYPRLTKDRKWIILYFVRFPKSSKI